MPYKKNIWSMTKELENMSKAKLGGKQWEEKRASGGFFPKEPTERTILKHRKKDMARKIKTGQHKHEDALYTKSTGRAIKHDYMGHNED